MQHCSEHAASSFTRTAVNQAHIPMLPVTSSHAGPACVCRQHDINKPILRLHSSYPSRTYMSLMRACMPPPERMLMRADRFVTTFPTNGVLSCCAWWLRRPYAPVLTFLPRSALACTALLSALPQCAMITSKAVSPERDPTASIALTTLYPSTT